MIFFVQNLIISEKLIINQKYYITYRIKKRMAYSLFHYN